MTPEQYQRAQRKLSRYGHRFETNLEQSLPAPLVKTKKGGIAKRQPKYNKKSKAYYQAQCSFRGLKTTGRIEELQALLQGRDAGNDAVCKAELDEIDRAVDTHLEQEEEQVQEQWWQDPARTLDDKSACDASRALKQVLGRGHAVGPSCYMFKEPRADMHQAAIACGLVCENVRGPATYGLSWPTRYSVIEHPTVVYERAQNISDQAAKAQRAYEARELAAQEAQKARLQAVLDEAKNSQEWDITGSWSIRCEELATFRHDRSTELTLTLFQDDYRLDEIRADTNNEESEEEYDYSSHLRGNLAWVYDKEPAPKPKKSQAPEKYTHIPRFHAKFDFSVVEGVMRLFPPEKSRNKSSFSIKASPTFDYIWRGRETGAGEIQITSDEHVEQLKFSEHGTKVEGVFRCEYMKPVRFVGTKDAHGRGQKQSSATAWSGLSEKAWNRECSSRWGGGW